MMYTDVHDIVSARYNCLHLRTHLVQPRAAEAQLLRSRRVFPSHLTRRSSSRCSISEFPKDTQTQRLLESFHRPAICARQLRMKGLSSHRLSCDAVERIFYAVGTAAARQRFEAAVQHIPAFPLKITVPTGPEQRAHGETPWRPQLLHRGVSSGSRSLSGIGSRAERA